VSMIFQCSNKLLAGMLMLSVLLLTACAGPQPMPVSEERMTVGTVQKEIQIGMSAAAVAEAMGSPNIVTTDEERREVWIYDKISAHAERSSGVGGLFLFFGGVIGSSSSASSSQKTLTVIIKFDEQKRVRDFAYHTSRF